MRTSALLRIRTSTWLLAVASVVPATAAAQIDIPRWSAVGDAAVLQAGTYRMVGLAGQSVVGTVSAGPYTLTGGFLAPHGTTLVGVDEGRDPTPGGGITQFQLETPRPNPFSRRTQLAFALPEPADVTLEIYDVGGARLRTLVTGRLPAGRYGYEWDATDADGRNVHSGVYLLHARLGSLVRSEKLVVLR